MKLITKSGILSSLAERIKNEYQMEGGTWYQSNWSKPLYEDISNLPADAPESDFIEIIGDDTWTRIKCDECQRSVDKVIDIGGSAAMLCPFCLNEAMGMLTERTTP